MARNYKSLGVVEDSFNLKEHGRSDGNNRAYQIPAFKNVLNSPMFKERLKLGELFGYFGHCRREMADKMDLAETEIVYVNENGVKKPVVIDNVPSHRLVDISVSDDGLVTHKQEFFDTPSGRAAKAMFEAGAGGWSMCVKGYKTIKGAVATALHGFDYVKHPSYVSTDKMQSMFESVGVENEDQLIEKMLENAGFADSKQVAASWERMSTKSIEDDISQLSEYMLFESQINDLTEKLNDVSTTAVKRDEMVNKLCDNIPVFLTSEQRQAMLSMQSSNDVEIVKSLFESLTKSAKGLPLSKDNVINPPASKYGFNLDECGILLGEKTVKFNY